jgi:hypothetical protein
MSPSVFNELSENKLILIAMSKIVCDVARAMGINLEGSLSEICEKAGVNRTQVYECRDRLEQILAKAIMAGPGRPCQGVDAAGSAPSAEGWEVFRTVMCFRLEHPGAYVVNPGGKISYSDSFIRLILDLFDTWRGKQEEFCGLIQVPVSTLRSWQEQDTTEPYIMDTPKEIPEFPDTASPTFRQITEDYCGWQGKFGKFLGYEARRLHVSPGTVRNVLRLSGLLPVKSGKSPRYRGSTQRYQPGTMLITDGKNIEVSLSGSQSSTTYNWQGMIDQGTACHTAVVITTEESADGVVSAFEKSSALLGRPPLALLHDNKPIYEEKKLVEQVSATTEMIPATLNRPENKALIEGEFGKFEQAVGPIQLDDSSREKLIESAVREAVRAYCAAGNHAGRAEFGGKSRLEVLRDSCPDPEKDRKCIEQLAQQHRKKTLRDTLPTRQISRHLLDAGFEQFGLTGHDVTGRLRDWLAGSYTSEAIRLSLAIFSAEQAKGRLNNAMAYRYLVKVIQNKQVELDLNAIEISLLESAARERQYLLAMLEREYAAFEAENAQLEITSKGFLLSEHALAGSLFLERAYWKQKLRGLLAQNREIFTAVRNHVKRVFEFSRDDRLFLINDLIAWEYEICR